MVFRIEAAVGAILMALPALAQEYAVRDGVVRVSAEAIRFEQKGRRREWKYDEIRELTLGETVLRVQTYEGSDREFVFRGAPRELAAKWYPVFSAKLDQRFVAALADPQVRPLWRVPVKLKRNVQGELLVGARQVVLHATPERESRTWRISDIESVASAGPFDLTVTTREKEFRLELKQAMAEARYQELWRAVNRARGLEILQ